MLSNQISRPALTHSAPVQAVKATAAASIPPLDGLLAAANPLQKFAFYMGLATLFVRVSVIAELILYVTGTSTYLLYFVGVPAILGCLFTGGIQRTFRHRAAIWWVAFFVWMVVAIPFSSWMGSSAHKVLDYGRTNLVLLVVVGGLAVSWSDIRKLFFTVAAAGIINLLSARVFLRQDNGRYSFEGSGTIGNPNDLAAHLIMVLPFLLYFVFDGKRSILTKAGLLGAIGYGSIVIVGTASRGALIALSLAFLILLLWASWTRRIVLIAGLGVVVTLLLAFTPASTFSRLGALWRNHIEAEESQASRMYLFKKSVEFTLQHPIFGVGPDQFANYEGKTSVRAGHTGSWHSTHCAFTQISSECGIPAFLFFIAGLGSALLSVNRTYKLARQQGHVDIANASLCLTLSIIGYLAESPSCPMHMGSIYPS